MWKKEACRKADIRSWQVKAGYEEPHILLAAWVQVTSCSFIRKAREGYCSHDWLRAGAMSMSGYDQRGFALLWPANTLAPLLSMWFG